MTEMENDNTARNSPGIVHARLHADPADAPISEITERFFKVIVETIAVDRIEELHLFSPLRQRGVQTGIAVIAARMQQAGGASDAESTMVAADAPGEAAPELALATVDVIDVIDEVAPIIDVDPSTDRSDTTIAPIEVFLTEIEAEGEELSEVTTDCLIAAAARQRHVVYTARYRLTQKGPERGKWEADVVNEADAPLLSVETVVRGVQRRAGDTSEITRYSGAQVARALRLE